MSKKKLFEELDVTVQGLKDFQACELYYKLENSDEPQAEILTDLALMRDKYETDLKNVAFYYFYERQGELAPSFDALIRRWEKAWFPKDMDAYDMSIATQKVRKENLKDFSNMAVSALDVFYEQFDDMTATPIMVDENVVVPLSRTIRLHVRQDLVLYRAGRFEVIKFIATRNNPRLFDYRLDLACSRLAFEHHHTEEQNRNTVYKLYNLGNPTSKFHTIPQPSERDIISAMYWAKEIEETKTFVPRRGFSSYCRGCKFDNQCLEYDWTDIEVEAEDGE